MSSSSKGKEKDRKDNCDAIQSISLYDYAKALRALDVAGRPILPVRDHIAMQTLY